MQTIQTSHEYAIVTSDVNTFTIVAIDKLADEFVRKVELTDDCWLWISARNKKGYGICNGGRAAHKVLWEAFYGRVPFGFELHHKCENENCIRLVHLDLLTSQQHNHIHGVRGVASENQLKTHCLRGHLLSSDNLITSTTNTKRRCKTCARDQQRLYRLR